MIEAVTLTMALALVGLMWFGGRAMASLGSIIQDLYQNDKLLWEKCGKPCGLFWVPSETSWYRGYNSGRRLEMNILLAFPDWVRASPMRTRLRRKALINFGFCVLAFFVVVAAQITTSLR
jgi:hypothetical protein